MTKTTDQAQKATAEHAGPEPATQPKERGGGNQPPRSAPPMAADNNEDPFDLTKLRVRQDFATQVGVRKVITTVPCRKPHRHEFVRVRPGEEWRLETAVFEDKVNRETYLVHHRLHGELLSEIVVVCLFTAITKQGDLFLWPGKLPSSEGRSNNWNESALAAARRAETNWIRVSSNMNAGCYDTFEAAGALSEPEWPETTFQDLIRLCFRGRFIDSHEHPVLRSLRGEV